MAGREEGTCGCDGGAPSRWPYGTAGPKGKDEWRAWFAEALGISPSAGTEASIHPNTWTDFWNVDIGGGVFSGGTTVLFDRSTIDTGKKRVDLPDRLDSRAEVKRMALRFVQAFGLVVVNDAGATPAVAREKAPVFHDRGGRVTWEPVPVVLRDGRSVMGSYDSSSFTGSAHFEEDGQWYRAPLFGNSRNLAPGYLHRDIDASKYPKALVDAVKIHQGFVDLRLPLYPEVV